MQDIELEILSEDKIFHQKVFDKLSVNQEFANFKALCLVLDEQSYSSSDTKRALENKFKRFFEWEKGKGYKIKITNVYDVSIPKVRSDSYASGFIPMFYYYIGSKLKEKDVQLQAPFKTDPKKNHYTCIITTREIASEIGLYNMLWKYAYAARNENTRPLFLNQTEKQSDIIYKMIENDMNTIVNNICYSGMSALLRENKAMIRHIYVYNRKNNQRLVPVDNNELINQFEGYYMKELKKGVEPLIAMEMANELLNQENGTNDFIHKAWNITVNKEYINGLFKISSDEIRVYEEFLQNKRIIKLRNRFEKHTVDWSDGTRLTKDYFEEFLQILTEVIEDNIRVNPDTNEWEYTILDKSQINTYKNITE